MTGPNDQPTRREYENLTAAMKDLTSTIERKFAQMEITYLRRDWLEVYKSDQKLHEKTHEEHDGDAIVLQKQIDGLKESNRWVWRSIFVAILTALTSTVVTALVMGGRT